jgi:hypothetical protein
MTHTITLADFEAIDSMLSQQLRAGDFATCADPRGYIRTSVYPVDGAFFD